MTTIIKKAGSVGVDFTDALTANNLPADLTGANNLHFELREVDGTPYLNVPATIVTPNPALVRYVSVSGDLDVPGVYLQVWRVDYTNGAVEFYPDEGYNTLVLEETLTPGTPGLGPNYGPCRPWISWADVEAVCTVPADLTPTVQSLILDAVTQVLWIRSGRQFGICTVTARPLPCCGHRRGDTLFGSSWWGGWGYGTMFDYGPGPNLAGGWAPCSCGRYNFVHLGREPIAQILSVMIDGVEISPLTYKVDEWNYLVRTDGEPWPLCQDLAADDGAPRTFVVQWEYGLDVPSGGKLSAALLACQRAKEIAEVCAGLPAGTTSLQRENITIQITDPATLLSGGLTGIRFVDDWLTAINPGGALGGGGIVDPGAHGQEWWRTNSSPVPPVVT